MSAPADCLTDVDAVISADPIRCETCNPAGVRFHQIVESGQIRIAGSDIRPSLEITDMTELCVIWIQIDYHMFFLLGRNQGQTVEDVNGID